MFEIDIFIPGEPKAQKRHRHTSVGKFVHIYDPSESDKGDFLSQVKSKAPVSPLLGPVMVTLTFKFSRPLSHYGTGKNAGKLKANAPYWHTKKPDRDNLDKMCLDAMSKVFWHDDSQICCGSITKVYSESPGTIIEVKELEENIQTIHRKPLRMDKINTPLPEGDGWN
jgi:Holliday junction resolvase RusA-like endonuclease